MMYLEAPEGEWELRRQDASYERLAAFIEEHMSGLTIADIQFSRYLATRFIPAADPSYKKRIASVRQSYL